jgi:hypothetical protein
MATASDEYWHWASPSPGRENHIRLSSDADHREPVCIFGDRGVIGRFVRSLYTLKGNATGPADAVSGDRRGKSYVSRDALLCEGIRGGAETLREIQ